MKRLLLAIILCLYPVSLFAGQAYEWGQTIANRTTAMTVLTDAVEMSAQSYWSLARRSDGSLYAWGDDTYNQITDLPAGTYISSHAGWTSGIAVKSDGSIVEWGRPNSGNHTIGVSPWIAPVTTSAVKVCGGDNHSAALLSDGTVRIWGGRTSNTDYDGDYTDVTDIACSWYATVMLREDGTVTVVGEDQNWLGETYDKDPPVGLTGVVKVTASQVSHYAIKSDGTAVGWGFYNGNGQLTMPETAVNLVDIKGGWFHTVALKSDGTVLAWGLNTQGQTTIPEAVTNIKTVGAGYQHSQAVKGKNYYVRTDGHDTNCNGGFDASAASAPNCSFLTVQKGVNSAIAGDTVLVGTGSYDEEVTTYNSGTADTTNGRIVIDGQDVATIKKFTFATDDAYITLQNFTIKGFTTQYYALVDISLGAHYSKVLGCTIDNEYNEDVYGIKWVVPTTAPFGVGDDSTPASHCTVSGNTLQNNKYQVLLHMFGDYNTVDSNTFQNVLSGDFFHIWGRYNTVSNNTFQTLDCLGECFVHPDWFQTYGDNCHGSTGHIIENNLVKNIKQGQLTQMTTDMITDISDITFRNNIFMNVAWASSNVVPQIKWYNNAFIRCNFVNEGHAIGFSSQAFDARCGNEAGTDMADYGKVFNNIFIESGDFSPASGWYSWSSALGDPTGLEADYNYVAKFAGTMVTENTDHKVFWETGYDSQEWWETHGYNGTSGSSKPLTGGPKFVNAPVVTTWAVMKGQGGDYDMEQTYYSTAITELTFWSDAAYAGNCDATWCDTGGIAPSTKEKNTNLTYVHAGAQSLHLVGNTGAGVYHREHWAPYGAHYTVSAWVYVVAGTVALKVKKGNSFATLDTSTTTGEWEQLTGDFATDDTVVGHALIVQATANSSEWYVDDVLTTVKFMSTTTIQYWNQAEAYFTIGQYVEIADDGVAREITAKDTDNNYITFSPALDAAPAERAVTIDCWGTNSTNMTLDLKLQSDSPLRGVGKNLSDVWSGATDRDGIARPLTGGWDIGPYQYDTDVTLDWRDEGGVNYVTAVRDQGSCGSCWAFAVTAALESQVIKSLSSTVDISEQVLISCAGIGNCTSGSKLDASSYVYNIGLPTESCYPYAEGNGSCDNACSTKTTKVYKFTDYEVVTQTVEALKAAIQTYGPIVADMSLYDDFYTFTGSGIYTHVTGDYVIGHDVLLIGYDDTNSYFIAKNSWGTSWGDSGYFKIAYSEVTGDCALGTQAFKYFGASYSEISFGTLTIGSGTPHTIGTGGGIITLGQ